MEEKMLLIIGALLFSLMTLSTVAPAASVEDDKYMWTIAVRCPGKGLSYTEKHCGTKADAIAAAKAKAKTQRGCEKPKIESAEKGEKCN